MAARSFQGKQMVLKHGFNAYDLSFGSLFAQGLCLLAVLLHFRDIEELSVSYLVIGTTSSILNTLGGVFLVKASSVGPLGPVNALFTSASSIIFSLIQYTRYGKPPTLFELLGMLLGIFGALILTMPVNFSRL